jgi:hypothetical protein
VQRNKFEELWLLAVIVALVGPAVVARSQEAAGTGAADLAMQLSNPIADLVSVPLQFNFADGVGPDEATRTILNIQPVVPFTLNDEWNLVGRWIMPFVSQPALAPGLESSYGMGDIVFSTFFSPRDSEGAIWGVGPVLSLPVTSDPTLGSGKWAGGPTFVMLKQSGPWTYGFLANYLWSFADATNENRADVDRGFVQPFLAYGTPEGVTYTINSESSYDRQAAAGDEWTVPINLVISKVTRLGPFPFQVGGGIGWYAKAPANGPDWQLRAQFTLILPRRE